MVENVARRREKLNAPITTLTTLGKTVYIFLILENLTAENQINVATSPDTRGA